MSFPTNAIRNIAIAGHGGTGKTTLFENLLYTGGTIPRPETVSSGKTVSDFTDEEVERNISIHLALGNTEWNNNLINIIDTPGASDFIGEVVAAFRTSESAVIVVGAKEGVQIETVKLWRRLNSRNKPRVAFINKLDTERADFDEPLADLRDKFDRTFVPITIPIAGAEGFRGIIDLIENKAYFIPGEAKEEATDVPEDMKDGVEEHRMALIEAAAEGDDALMEKYFEEETLSEDEIRQGLKAAYADNKLVPVFCGAAELCSGVAPLLSFFSATAPDPSQTVEIADEGGEAEKEVTVDSSGDPSCYSFKTSIDQFSGKLSFVKVITGSLKSDIDSYIANKSTRQKIGKLFRAVGKTLVDADELQAGDIGVLTKIDALETGYTLCSQDQPVTYGSLRVPQPVHSVAIFAESKKDEDKMNQFLQRSAEEDTTFTLNYDAETKQTVISGMGELHINMILDRIKEKQHIEIGTKVPKVPYRETITKSSDAEYTHKKQTGGHGQYGRVVLQIKPLQRGEQYEFENSIKGGSISRGYIPGVEKGILEAMESGILAGFPVVDLGASVVDGKEHPVDSSEMSFKLASKGALMAAMEKASPVLLEPVAILHVYTNEDHVGDILSDLSSRRG